MIASRSYILGRLSHDAKPDACMAQASYNHESEGDGGIICGCSVSVDSRLPELTSHAATAVTVVGQRPIYYAAYAAAVTVMPSTSSSQASMSCGRSWAVF